MAQAIFKKTSSPAISAQMSRADLQDVDASYVGPAVQTKSEGWSERRVLFLSPIYKGDRKLAFALYLIFMVLVIYVAYA